MAVPSLELDQIASLRPARQKNNTKIELFFKNLAFKSRFLFGWVYFEKFQKSDMLEVK